MTESLGGTVLTLHDKSMFLIWSPLVDIMILCAVFNTKKNLIYGHILCGYFISIWTMVINFQLLAKVDFSQIDQGLKKHVIIGTICTVGVGIQMLLGLLTSGTKISQGRSKMVIRFKAIHTYFGYLLVILCKLQLLFMLNSKNNSLLLIIFLVIELLFLIILLYRKLLMPSLGKTILPTTASPNIQRVREIKSLSELPKNQQALYAVFSNKVYDLSVLKQNHPAGYQIIQSVNGREIDRYLYGMYSSQKLPQVPVHSHSSEVFGLVGPAIAEIIITPLYQNFVKETYEVSISNLVNVSQKGGIYEMDLTSKQFNFKFNKYTDIRQLGRFYSLTLNKKVTRLYTMVNFLNIENIKFIKEKYLSLGNPKNSRLQKYLTDKKSTVNILPLLFKRYQNGVLTSQLTNGKIPESLILSCAKGEGLKLGTTNSGKILIVAGGTGLYPFSDLIDLMFKISLARAQTHLRDEVYRVSPILSNRSLEQFSFKLYAAFNSIEDIHPITLQQLLYLGNERNSNFEIALKVRQPFDSVNFYNIHLQKDGFEKNIEADLKNSSISKIWVCGPPKMNEGMTKFVSEDLRQPELLHLL